MNGGQFNLYSEELALVQDACTHHTMGFTEANVIVRTCWDADRLDLPRVDKFPVPELLCTAPARNPAFMELTRQRSISNHIISFTAEIKILIPQRIKPLEF